MIASGVRHIMVRDPDGNVLEFIERRVRPTAAGEGSQR